MMTSNKFESYYFKESINDKSLFKVIFLAGGPGSGKCLGEDVEVLMYDGSIKKCKDLVVGDNLMGPDSTSRTILKLLKSKGNLFKVVPVKGESWNCSEDHKLVISTPRRTYKNKKVVTEYIIKEISINDFIKSSKRFQSKSKLIRTGVEYPSKDLKIDPYFMGLWLGDGHKHMPAITSMDEEIIKEIYSQAEKWKLQVTINEKNNSKAQTYCITKGNKSKLKNNLLEAFRYYNIISKVYEESKKRIPKDYLINSRQNRLKLLAGLLDTDGYYKNGCFGISQKSENLINDILILSRSLGFATYKSIKYVNKIAYYTLSISGNTDEIPTKLPRKQSQKRKQIKNVLHTGFIVEAQQEGNYISFTLDKDGKHLLADFTITHNSFISKLAFAGEPIVYIGSDTFTEILLKKEDLPLVFNKGDIETYNKQQSVRDKSINLTTKRLLNHINGMLSIVIDGTGRDYNKIFKLRENLKELGYDSYMVFVNTSLDVARKRNQERKRKLSDDDVITAWKNVQENIGKFQSLFGNENFIVIDNNKKLDENEIKKLELILTRMARKFLNEPLKNIVGKNTLLKMKKTGAQYLSDLDSNIIKKNPERFTV